MGIIKDTIEQHKPGKNARRDMPVLPFDLVTLNNSHVAISPDYINLFMDKQLRAGLGTRSEMGKAIVAEYENLGFHVTEFKRSTIDLVCVEAPHVTSYCKEEETLVDIGRSVVDHD
jgi:hypothetical protein